MRLVRYFFYVLSLYLIETLLCFAGLMTLEAVNSGDWRDYYLSSAWRDSLETNTLRIIFYFVLQFIFFVVVLENYRAMRRTFRVAILNAALYVAISSMYSAIMPFTAGYLHRDFFYVLIASTLISPFLLNLVPAFRLVIERSRE